MIKSIYIIFVSALIFNSCVSTDDVDHIVDSSTAVRIDSTLGSFVENRKILYFFALIPLILSIGIAPIMPSVIAQADEDTQCRDEQILVFKFNANNYGKILLYTYDNGHTV